MIELKLQLLEDYYNENKTINNINQNYEVIVNNKTIKIGSFLNDIRKQHKKYLINPKNVSEKNRKRFEFLEKLNIDWNPKESEWIKKYYLLKEYKSVYGNIDVPYEYELNGVPIGVFVANQRVLKRNNPKPKKELENHFKMLERLGINWNPQIDDWNTKYEKCKKFYNENNHLNIEDNYIYENTNIGNFITNQRLLYQKYKNGTVKRKDTKILKNRFKELENIGMIWYPNKEKQELIIKELKKYKKEHGNINIPIDYKTKINNEDFNLGIYIAETREIYRKNINHLEKLNHNKQERIKTLEDLGITWNPSEDYWQIRYNLLKDYKKEFGTINIKGNYIIQHNKENINLGRFINKQRELYRKHQQTNFIDCDENIKNHFKLLEKLGISWNPQKEEWKKNYNLLKKYYEKNKNIDIPLNYIEIVDGKEIKLGQIARNQKESLIKRRESIILGKAPAEIMLRYSLLKNIGFSFIEPIIKYNYEGNTYSKNELCNKLGITISSFNKYIKVFNNDEKKAIRVCLIIKKIKENKQKTNKKPTLNYFLQTFNINIDELEQYLNKESLKESQKTSNIILYKDNTTLKKYCIDNGYNYEIISYILKVKENKYIDDTLDKVIDRVLIDYKKLDKPPTWIYSKYGNELLLKHFLTSISLDYKSIIKDITKNAITLEEAIRNNCFNFISKKNNHDYLEELYINIIEKYNKSEEDKLDQYINNIIEIYKLNTKEKYTLIESLNKYKKSINKYHIYEVGYTNNLEQKIELINKYQLTDSEIEDSFFVNINYENHILIDKESEEYKKRKARKKLVKKWNNLEEKEKIELIKKNKLQYPEDYNIITIIRNNINHLQNLVFKSRIPYL